MAIYEYTEDEAAGLIRGRGKIQVFRVLEILPPIRARINEGMVVQIHGGDKVLLGATPHYFAYRAKRRYGPDGTRGLTAEERQAWRDEFFQSLMWPSGQKDNDIAIGKDHVYAELIDRGEKREVAGHGALPVMDINDGFRVFSRGERLRQSRGETPDKLEAEDQIILGYARILRDPSRPNGTFVEMVSDPRSFSSYSDLQEYLLASIGSSNINGHAVNLTAKESETGKILRANYFPQHIENHRIVSGSSAEEVRGDLQMIRDRGIDIDSVFVFETTRAFLDATAWKRETGKASREFNGMMFYIYKHNTTEKQVDVEMVEWFSGSAGRKKKKGPPSYMIRSIMSRTMYDDPKMTGVGQRPAKVRVLIPVAEGDLITSQAAYVFPVRSPAVDIKPVAPEHGHDFEDWAPEGQHEVQNREQKGI